MRPLSRTPRFLTGFVAALLLGLVACGAADAQSIDSKVAAVGDGTAVVEFPVREDVCGNGAGMIRTGPGDHVRFRGSSDAWSDRCVPGPGRLVIRVREGRVIDLDPRVGGASLADLQGIEDPARVVDLGSDEAGEIAGWLLDLARRSPGDPGEDAVFALTLIRDVEPWEDLVSIARDEAVRGDTREDATFWLAHAAGEKVAGDLEELADDEAVDLEVREAAVFALSELDDEERAVASLMKVYRESEEPRIRRKALFWLGESGDPRALALFEEILLEE